MKSTGRVALLAGASGLVGGHLLDRLLAAEDVTRVVALVRRPLARTDARLSQRTVDFAHLNDVTVEGATDAFCALGTTIGKAGSKEAFRRVDFDAVVAFARLALRSGAVRFLLVSSTGADPRSLVFYTRVKGEVEAAVSALAFQAVHLFRPSFLLGDRVEARPAERVGILVAKAIAPSLLGPLAKYRPVEAATVAAAMVGASRSGARGVTVHEGDAIPLLAGG